MMRDCSGGTLSSERRAIADERLAPPFGLLPNVRSGSFSPVARRPEAELWLTDP